MKKFKYLYPIVAILLGILAGCNKWLDVQPSDQISSENLFEDPTGYRNALNGIYQQASTPELFGRELSWGTYSVLGQDYTNNTISSVYQYVSEYDLSNASVQTLGTSIWQTAYNTIANCNKLIHEIEETPSERFELDSIEKNLIHGEALAMRGLLHFELLRLYGSSPAVDPSGRYIPYQTAYPQRFSSPVTNQEAIGHILADLKKAQALVVENDTLVNINTMRYKLQSLLTGSSVTKGGLFFNFRMHRLNYVAIHGLMARVYLYAGDYANAKKEAKYVYENYGPHGRLKWWVFTSESNTSGVDKYSKLVDDVIFAFYNPEQITETEDYKVNYYTFTLSPQVSEWFSTGERDHRQGLINSYNISEKWLENVSTAQYRSQQNFIIPVLRMSEIYYIYSECLFQDGNTDEALTVLNQIRNARGKTSTFSNTDPSAFYNELISEYRREFLVEGQTVFAHKRLDRDITLGTQVIPMDDRFIMPIPEGELIF